MASIQRVASTFFRAIDEKQGTPYVFQRDRKPTLETNYNTKEPDDPASEDSDQEELDRFIAEIEDAADQEWAEEEAADKEEATKIRYWSKEEMGQQGRNTNRRDFNSEEDVRGRERGWDNMDSKRRITKTREWNSNDEFSGEDIRIRGRGRDSKRRTTNTQNWNSNDGFSEEDIRIHERGRDNMDSKRRIPNVRTDNDDEITEEYGEEWDSSEEVRNDGGQEDITDDYDDLEDSNRELNGGRTRKKSGQVITRSDRELKGDSDVISWVSDDDGEGPDTKEDDYNFLSSDGEESYNGRNSQLENRNGDDVGMPANIKDDAYNYLSSDDECGDESGKIGGKADIKNIDEQWDSD